MSVGADETNAKPETPALQGGRTKDVLCAVADENQCRHRAADPLHRRKAVPCETPVTPLSNPGELVSCLCVTRNRVSMLRRAVNCFLDQTYEPRELVVVHRADDSATVSYLEELQETSIRTIEVPCSLNVTLGELRNLALDASRGRYIATWDDDDWHSPLRLASQIDVMHTSNKPACLLSRLVIYDQVTGKAYLSGQRMWEGSLVARRNVITDYPELPRGEDKVVVDQLIVENIVVGLDSPNLYIYVAHGANTWNVDHWTENLLPFAQALTPESAERIKTLLDQHLQAPAAKTSVQG